MTFTDDDLARTKREIPEGLKGYGFDSMYSFSVKDLQALLHRLECAERVIRMHVVEENPSRCRCFKDWKKAAGK